MIQRGFIVLSSFMLNFMCIVTKHWGCMYVYYLLLRAMLFLFFVLACKMVGSGMIRFGLLRCTCNLWFWFSLSQFVYDLTRRLLLYLPAAFILVIRRGPSIPRLFHSLKPTCTLTNRE